MFTAQVIDNVTGFSRGLGLPINGLPNQHKLARYRWIYWVRQFPDSANNFTNVYALVDAANRAESAGGAVSTALTATGEFPQELLSLWSTGEQSGHLDDMLQRLARMYAERCELRMQEIAKWLHRLAYAAVSLYLAIQILRMGANYANLLRSVE